TGPRPPARRRTQLSIPASRGRSATKGRTPDSRSQNAASSLAPASGSRFRCPPARRPRLGGLSPEGSFFRGIPMSDYLPVPLSRRGSLDYDSAAARLLRAFLNGRKAETITAYRQDLEDFQAFIQAPSLEQAASLLL